MAEASPSGPTVPPARKSSHHVPSGKLRKLHDIELFRRAGSALASHRPHRLSDIRETSNSSRSGTVKNRSSAPTLAAPTTPSAPSTDGPSTPLVQQAKDSTSNPCMYVTPCKNDEVGKTQSQVLSSRATSSASLPLAGCLERGSSLSIFSRSRPGSRRSSSQDLPKWRIPPAASGSRTVPNRGRADSPVRRAMERSSQSSETVRSSPLKTIIRTTPPLDILDRANTRHDRLQMSVHLQSPLFVGGGTVEGQLFLDVDKGSSPRKATLKPLMMSRLSIDVIGVEEVNDGRRWVFLSLGTEVLDPRHPPPPSIAESSRPGHGPELSWRLKSGSALVPFCLNLPLNLGPPPYVSKQASIRYFLVPTAYFQSGEKKGMVRSTWNIQMLTVYDPEKALASLPNPLLAADTLVIAHTPEVQSVKLTAGLHRQTWVNGGKIFVDVHVVNQSPKVLKKLEVQLEKTTLWYTHAAAGTVEKSANHLRLPKRTDFKIVGSTLIKKNSDWRGIPAYSSEVRTCELNVRRGHVTISTGRYFEVRFFVNVIIYASRFRSCAVQLPVTLIHMNSLDILPNSLAQVAASIEAKRARTVPVSSTASIHQQMISGQAFAAPREQSLSRAGCDGFGSNNISLLTQDVERSPKRYGSSHSQHGHRHCCSICRSSRATYSETSSPKKSKVSCAPQDHHQHHKHNYHHHDYHHHHHHHHRHDDEKVQHGCKQDTGCCQCSGMCKDAGERPGTGSSHQGPSLPRLQVSTSGLGFSESEFEIPADPPPRKVMLSEHERKMIQQQKEVRLQREYSQRKREMMERRGSGLRNGGPVPTWRNVTMDSSKAPAQPVIRHHRALSSVGSNVAVPSDVRRARGATR